MLRATAKWRRTGDLLAQFLIEQVDVTGDARDGVSTRALHERFPVTLPPASKSCH